MKAKRYEFKAILNKDDSRTGYRKGKAVFPKGFYYQKKIVVLVGDIQTGHTIRLAFPIDSIDIEITTIKETKCKDKTQLKK